MLVIKPFPHKHLCNARRCNDLDVFTVTPEGEPVMFGQFYCKEHLLEIGRIANKYFEVEQTETEKMINDHFHTNPPLDKLPEDKSQETQLSQQDIEQLKAELLSVKATNELFKENIEVLTKENNKLKQANKAPAKKPDKRKGR